MEERHCTKKKKKNHISQIETAVEHNNPKAPTCPVLYSQPHHAFDAVMMGRRAIRPCRSVHVRSRQQKCEHAYRRKNPGLLPITARFQSQLAALLTAEQFSTWQSCIISDPSTWGAAPPISNLRTRFCALVFVNKTHSW